MINWTIEPPLPEGLLFDKNDGSIIGSPSELHALREHYVTASNTGGSITINLILSVLDISPINILYEPYNIDLTVNEIIPDLTPMELELRESVLQDASSVSDQPSPSSSLSTESHIPSESVSVGIELELRESVPQLDSSSSDHPSLSSNYIDTRGAWMYVSY